MSQRVDISFDCIPLRSLGRVDIPLDASPAYQAKCERIKEALAKHGQFNAYYLHNAKCVYHLTNDESRGMLEFMFEGTVHTDPADRETHTTDLSIDVTRETCDWLTEPIVEWFHQTVEQAVLVEFDRYISAGDLDKTVARIEALQKESDEHDGFVGMGL